MHTDLLSTRQVAEIKNVTVKTVNVWAKSGRLPVADTLPLSNARLFDPTVVAAFDPRGVR